MSVMILDEILEAAWLKPSEFCREIALHLFAEGRLTWGYASQLTSMEPRDFRELLKPRHILLYEYDVAGFELDRKNLQKLGQLS